MIRGSGMRATLHRERPDPHSRHCGPRSRSSTMRWVPKQLTAASISTLPLNFLSPQIVSSPILDRCFDRLRIRELAAQGAFDQPRQFLIRCEAEGDDLALSE